VILIGPEGDFSPAEVEAAIAAGFVPVTMGNNRLRTETAALVACDTCHIINQLNS
jgi:16S rRNA (uracil1498-N3)-methyltransferase